MRKAFIQTLLSAATKDCRVMLLTGDLGFTVFEEFVAKLPHQFINTGVAEQNLVGIGSGLALTGRIVFCYSIASFATSRAYEQIKIDVAAHGASVILVGTGGGLSYSTASITHHALDDVALMRLIPGLTIFTPADAFEVIWAVKRAIKINGPSYIRLTKQDEPDIHVKADTLTLGKGFIVRPGNQIALFASGAGMSLAVSTVTLLEKKNIHPTLISMHTIKPFDSELVESISKTHELIVTIEEHGLIGGLGSAVADVLSNTVNKSRHVSIGVADTFLYSIGTLEYMRQIAGLDPRVISRKIIEKLTSKK